MTIAAYLQAPYNYQIGIDLLKANDPYNDKLPKLENRYSIINEKILVKELKALVSLPNKPTTLPNKPTTLPKKVSTPPPEEVKIKKIEKATSDFEKTIKDLKIEKARLLQEASNAHTELRSILNQKQRFIRAQLIVKNWNRINKIWEILDYIDKYNRLPAWMEKADDFEVGAELIRKRNNLRTYVTKYQKLIESTTKESLKIKYDEKLRKYQFELSNIEKQVR